MIYFPENCVKKSTLLVIMYYNSLLIKQEVALNLLIVYAEKWQ